jgi:poly(A) polymerase
MISEQQPSNIAQFPLKPRIVARAEHNISRQLISDNALKVLYRLKKAGYQAYLVGGGVRDLLLGREPKDFDVATNALPEQVRELFRNCRLIGRRFRLAHVHFGPEIIEVSTFRAAAEPLSEGGAGDLGEHVRRANVYGTIDQDVWRRDFTVNALFYNIDDFSVIDYVGGLRDLRDGCLRVIGDPEARYREDPVRMLRAVRFAVKLGFRMHPDTAAPIYRLSHLLAGIPPARLFEEFLKLFLGGCAVQTFEQLRHFGLFARLFPQTDALLQEIESGFPHIFVARALQNTDQRLAEGRPVTPAFLIATLLWEPVRKRGETFIADGLSEYEALNLASDAVISKQVGSIALPRRFTQVAREIWLLQVRLRKRQGRRPVRLLSHPRFRAAYDFLLLRAAAGEPVAELAEWWTRFQAADSVERGELLKIAHDETRVSGQRRRRR